MENTTTGHDEHDDVAAHEIAREVEVAFRDVPYPGDEDLIGSPNHWESPEVLDSFQGRHWRGVPLTVLFTHRLSLSLFSPKAFLFYLPAYLIAALLHSEEVDTLG